MYMLCEHNMIEQCMYFGDNNGFSMYKRNNIAINMPLKANEHSSTKHRYVYILILMNLLNTFVPMRSIIEYEVI